MPKITKTIEVDIGEIGDRDLIQEMENRGYIISRDEIECKSIPDVEWNYHRGNLKEAMICLERVFPNLKGISEKI